MNFFKPDRDALRAAVLKLSSAVSPEIKGNFKSLAPADAAQLLEHTLKHYANNITDEGDIEKTLALRLDEDRHVVIPWLNAAIPLKGARVLEIGCGTGESTLALAEQGAIVTGIDVDSAALEVGRERIRLHGLSAEFINGNAADAAALTSNRTFDLVVYFASLEHMTLDERLASMTQTWNLTRPGGAWCVNEAPNRLWYYDGHTSYDNFYNWLPDELAAKWAHLAPRKAFAEAFPAGAPFDSEKVARWGRGVSFHDLDVAIGSARQLEVVSHKRDFLLAHNPLMRAYHFVSKARKFERFLEGLAPDLHPAFFRQYFDVIIRKPS